MITIPTWLIFAVIVLIALLYLARFSFRKIDELDNAYVVGFRKGYEEGHKDGRTALGTTINNVTFVPPSEPDDL